MKLELVNGVRKFGEIQGIIIFCQGIFWVNKSSLNGLAYIEEVALKPKGILLMRRKIKEKIAEITGN